LYIISYALDKISELFNNIQQDHLQLYCHVLVKPSSINFSNCIVILGFFKTITWAK